MRLHHCEEIATCESAQASAGANGIARRNVRLEALGGNLLEPLQQRLVFLEVSRCHERIRDLPNGDGPIAEGFIARIGVTQSSRDLQQRVHLAREARSVTVEL